MLLYYNEPLITIEQIFFHIFQISINTLFENVQYVVYQYETLL